MGSQTEIKKTRQQELDSRLPRSPSLSSNTAEEDYTCNAFYLVLDDDDKSALKSLAKKLTKTTSRNKTEPIAKQTLRIIKKNLATEDMFPLLTLIKASHTWATEELYKLTTWYCGSEGDKLRTFGELVNNDWELELLEWLNEEPIDADDLVNATELCIQIGAMAEPADITTILETYIATHFPAELLLTEALPYGA